MSELELTVEGMMCGGCENSIEKVVGAMNGVQNVKADHEADKVLVVGEGLDREAVAKCITDAGYIVKD
ncbi:MerTP family mercury permease [Pavlovales sp. CCMP2436]|nr:MerTP family mercury permease [Pavlovales sp. CCMP2436]